MGSIFHKPYTPFQQLFHKKELRALVFGLDFAGKSTMLIKLNIGEVKFDFLICFDSVEFQKVKLDAWDVGLNPARIRCYLAQTYKDTNAVIYVVDSSDKQRIELASQELKNLLLEDRLKNTTLLVLANKQDLGGMSVDQVSEKLDLHGIQQRKWKIFGTCAETGDGLYQAFQWLCEAASTK